MLDRQTLTLGAPESGGVTIPFGEGGSRNKQEKDPVFLKTRNEMSSEGAVVKINKSFSLKRVHPFKSLPTRDEAPVHYRCILPRTGTSLRVTFGPIHDRVRDKKWKMFFKSEFGIINLS